MLCNPPSASSLSEVINKYRGTVNGRWVDLIKTKLHHQKIDQLPPPAYFNIPLEDWTSCSDPVPVDGVRQLLYWAVEKTEDPLLPIDLGLSLQPLHINSLGIVLWSTASVRQRVEKLETYQSLVTTTTRIVLNETSGLATLLLIDSDPVDKSVNLTRLGMMALVATIVGMLRWENTTELKITVHLPFEPPEWSQKLREKLGCTIKYCATQYRVEFDADELDQPLTASNPELLQAVERLVQDKLLVIEQNNLVLRVSRSLFELTPFTPPSTAEMAQVMNMSSRTFQRKLTELGLSYRELVSKIRYEKAISLMESCDKTLSTVAYELGFGDLSSFSRAFKNWAGISPKKYRSAQIERSLDNPLTKMT